MHPGLDVIRAGGEYTLPDDIADKVSIVEKLIRLPSLEAPKIGAPSEVVQKLRGAGGDDPFNSCDTKLCTGATTPAVLQARYGYPKLSNYTKGNGMAVAEFQFQGVDDEDLSNFASTCAVDHVSVDTTEGAGGNLMPGVEALLDVEYVRRKTILHAPAFSLSLNIPDCTPRTANTPFLLFLTRFASIDRGSGGAHSPDGNQQRELLSLRLG
jgi:hypothetical protein